MKTKTIKFLYILVSLIVLAAFFASLSYAWYSLVFNDVEASFIVNGEILPDVFGRDPNYTGSAEWGTEANPFYINTIFHYENLCTLNNTGKLGEGYYFKLGDNIDFTGVTVSPIGTHEYPFLDHFDGDGKILSNLTVRSDSIDIGVFGCIGRTGFVGEVKNLILDNITVYSYSSFSHIGLEHSFSDKNPKEARHIGIFCGHLQGQAGNISVGNSVIDLSGSETGIDHYSKYSTVGICSDGAQVWDGSSYMDVDPGESTPMAGANIGYLYIDHYYDAILSGQYAGLGTQYGLNSNVKLPGVGVFSLITGNANQNKITPFPSPTSTVYFADAVSVTSGGTLNATTGNTQMISLSDVYPTDSDSVKRFKHSIVDPYNNFTRITSFKDGLFLAKYSDATYTVLNPDGTASSTPPQTGTTGVITFEVDYNVSSTADILCLFMNAKSGSPATLSIREVGSDGTVGNTPIFNITSSVNNMITGALFEFDHDTLYGSGTTRTTHTYAFCDGSSGQASTQMVYFAVGGQNEGEGGQNTHTNSVYYNRLASIDFIYDVLIPVNTPSYVPTYIIPYFKDGTATIPIDQAVVYYSRAADGGSRTFTINVTGGDADERNLFNYVDLDANDTIVFTRD